MNKVFEALAHPARRKILALLKGGSMGAGELADHFDLSKPTMSVHFNKLKDAELVTTQRDGTNIIYSLNMSVLEQALSGVLDLKDHLNEGKKSS
ncbi:autorepressor SdpR family transcription factor [Labrenzia sp. PHM005]|uniref:autorepressor SdpR family transcription factor n=1 Tax=Labrenzia sp. PHM005 TaxID=2590016 RepID=UPI0011400ACB|nr:autorepressor SdpR family transcription factor [Labrenzia sp. PHM005]QDG79106.1 winged helix-turn-helix transcriptional regulator [Labrenzia sp. PHM005]